MIGIVALVAAVLFGAISAYRLVGTAPFLRHAAAGAALAAAVLGAAHWQATGDTRWVVGCGLMLGALAATFLNNSRTAFILSLILGDLGLMLFLIALVTGYHPR